MDFSVPQVIVYLVAWAALSRFAFYAFEQGDEVVSDGTRRRLAKWLLNKLGSPVVTRWPHFFSELFDETFGKSHWTARCFIRSVVASLFAVFIVSITLFALRYESILLAFSYRPPGFSLTSFILPIVFDILTYNFIADYISLFETRKIIILMQKRGAVSRSLLVGVDLIATFLIYFVVATIQIGIVMALLNLGIINSYFSMPPHLIFPVIDAPEATWEGMLSIFAVWDHTLTIQEGAHQYLSEIMLSVLLYSTFLSSAWLWLFLLGATTIRTLQILGRHLDVRNKPFRSVGVVSVLIITLAFLLWPILK